MIKSKVGGKLKLGRELKIENFNWKCIWYPVEVVVQIKQFAWALLALRFFVLPLQKTNRKKKQKTIRK